MIQIIEPLVSIVMPSYNAEKFICEGIESVLSQTYKNWELLIVNDCSKDNTAKVVTEYSIKDDRIKLFNNENNSGPAITRNNALNRAKGRFIAFLDSDDVWLPEKLEIQISVMLEKGYVFTYTDYHRISENGMVSGRRINVPNSLSYFQLLRNTAITTSTVILDIDAIGKVKMKETYYDDFTCWLEVMKRGFTAYRVNENLLKYRVASSSVSRNKINSAIQVWNTYRSIEGLGLLISIWCFTGYALNALKKYNKF